MVVILRLASGFGVRLLVQEGGDDVVSTPSSGGPSWAGVRRGGGSPPLLAVDGEGQRDVERVVVLDQRGVLVVQDQLLQGAVQVVGLGEAEAGARLVDDAVLHLPLHPEEQTHRLAPPTTQDNRPAGVWGGGPQSPRQLQLLLLLTENKRGGASKDL